jgi:hypothetical protein
MTDIEMFSFCNSRPVAFPRVLLVFNERLGG